MSVTLCTYGKHSLSFDGLTLVDPGEVIARLNALHLEDSPFLREKCEAWHTPVHHYKAEHILREQESLREALGTREWRLESEGEMGEDWYEYTFVGPYGLEVDVTKTFVSPFVWTSRYFFWFKTEADSVAWRNSWRTVLRRIIGALGGEYALYYPDNLYELSAFLPTEYGSLDLDEVIAITRREYPWCVDNFAKAVEFYHRHEGARPPFFVDRFEDLD